MLRAGTLAAMIACVACRARFGELADSATGDPGDGTTCTTVPGLLVYFPMNAGDIALQTLLDHSGNAHHGAITGSPQLTPGHDSECLDFTATTLSYVDVAGLPIDATAGAAVTVSLWFFHASSGVNDVLIDFPPSPRYDLWLTNNTQLCINTQFGECWGIDDSNIFGRWTHVVAVLKNGLETDSYFYIDGARVAITCTLAACTTSRTVMNPLRLGANDTYDLQGKLDDVRLYDHELSPADVTALFENTVCR